MGMLAQCGVTRGLDPRVHLLRETLFAKKVDCTGTRACPSSALLEPQVG